MIQVIGADGVSRMLRDYMEPKLPRRMQDATKAGATVFKAPLKAAARALSRRLARAVSVKKAKREKPATIVVFRAKVAWFRHFIIGGTKDHGPRRAQALVFDGRNGIVRARRVRGVPAHPIVGQVADRYERQAYDAIDRHLDSTETA